MMLTTGGTGTTRREIARQLSVAVSQARALIRQAETASALKGSGVERVIGDIK